MRPSGERLELRYVTDYESATTGDVTTTVIDMEGWDSVLFIGLYGTAASNNICHLEQDTALGFGDDSQDLEGTLVGAGSSDEAIWVEVVNPTDRYVRAIFQRGTSSDLGPVLAILKGGKTFPADNTISGTIYGEIFSSPAEGTK